MSGIIHTRSRPRQVYDMSIILSNIQQYHPNPLYSEIGSQDDGTQFTQMSQGRSRRDVKRIDYRRLDEEGIVIDKVLPEE